MTWTEKHARAIGFYGSILFCLSFWTVFVVACRWVLS